MPHSISSGSLTIILQQYTSLVLLIHDVISDIVAVCFNKVAVPDYLGHEIIIPDNLLLCIDIGI